MIKSNLRFSKLFIINLAILLVTLTLNVLFRNDPELTENLYYKGLYTWFRMVWDGAFAWCPVPLFYLWIIVLIGLLIVLLKKVFTGKVKGVQGFRIMVIFCIAHFTWFYWSWGFNYGRTTLGNRWNINNPVHEDQFLNEFALQTRLVDSLRMKDKVVIDTFQFNSQSLENEMRNLVIDFMHKNGFRAFDRVRCRNLSISGILLIWSTSGVYLPFVGESQLDGGLHKLSKPFTMAHELCHGMGWTHEGDCNFMAYLICSASTDPFVRYSGELNYWRYLAANASRNHTEEYKHFRSSLNSDVISDLNEINKANNQFPEIFPELRKWFYDWYLRNNGIASGDKSYSEIIRMVIHYKERAEYKN